MSSKLESLPATFGKRVMKLREKKGLTQKELAKAVGVSTTTANSWESMSSGAKTKNKTGTLKLINALNLCRVLECDLGYLLGEYDQQKRTTTDICKETGLSFEAVQTLQMLDNPGNEKMQAFIDDLLSSPEDLCTIAFAYADYTSEWDYLKLLQSKKYEDSNRPYSKGDKEYIANKAKDAEEDLSLRLYHRIERFAQKSAMQKESNQEKWNQLIKYIMQEGEGNG